MQWRLKACRSRDVESAFVASHQDAVKAWKQDRMTGRTLNAATEATVAATELYSNSSTRIDYSGGRRLKGGSIQRTPAAVHASWSQG